MSIVDDLLAKHGLRTREVFPPSIRTRYLLIGPREASALLEANQDNRPLRKNRVAFYARQMKKGDWRLTHQGIAFSSDGTGVDLQHRLSAVIESGVEITIMVTEGLERAAFQAIDQHERRSMADALRIPKSLSEEAKMMLTAARGDRSPLLSEVAEVAAEIEVFSDALMDGCNTRRAVVSTVPVRCAAIVLMNEGEPEQIIENYRRIVLHQTESWSPAMHAFGRQVANGSTAGWNSSTRRELMARSLIALDPKRSGVTKIQLKDGWQTALSERVEKSIWPRA